MGLEWEGKQDKEDWMRVVYVVTLVNEMNDSHSTQSNKYVLLKIKYAKKNRRNRCEQH